MKQEEREIINPNDELIWDLYKNNSDLAFMSILETNSFSNPDRREIQEQMVCDYLVYGEVYVIDKD